MFKIFINSLSDLALCSCFFLPEYDLGHVPKLTDFNSVLDLFTFCNLMVMMNVLDFRTYLPVEGVPASVGNELWDKHDANSIQATERYEMAYARGRCWDIYSWFFTVYELFDKDSGETIDGMDDVAMVYLTHQASAILEFKRRAMKCGLDDERWGSMGLIEKQIKLCFLGLVDVPPIVPLDSDSDVSLAFPDANKYGVRKLGEIGPYERKSVYLK